MDFDTDMSRCGVAAVMPAPYRSVTSCPSCSTTSASVYVPAKTSAAVAVLPSSRQTGGAGRAPAPPARGAPPPAAPRPAGGGAPPRPDAPHRHRGGRPLPVAAAAEDQAGLLAVPVTRAGQSASPGSISTVADVLADTCTDAYLVLQDGELVTEWYGPLGAPDRPHALMSVSKSVVGCVAAVLADRGQLDVDREITAYVPELAASGYAGALVRHVLDMLSGVRFLEEYANPAAY